MMGSKDISSNRYVRVRNIELQLRSVNFCHHIIHASKPNQNFQFFVYN